MTSSSVNFWFTYSLGLCMGHVVDSWSSLAISIPLIFAVLWYKDWRLARNKPHAP